MRRRAFAVKVSGGLEKEKKNISSKRNCKSVTALCLSLFLFLIYRLKLERTLTVICILMTLQHILIIITFSKRPLYSRR